MVTRTERSSTARFFPNVYAEDLRVIATIKAGRPFPLPQRRHGHGTLGG